MRIPEHADDRLWSVEDVSTYLAVPVATLYKWRCSGHGPKGLRMGRYLRYRQVDVLSWLDRLADAA